MLQWQCAQKIEGKRASKRTAPQKQDPETPSVFELATSVSFP
jgi:hypothetical protein